MKRDRIPLSIGIALIVASFYVFLGCAKAPAPATDVTLPEATIEISQPEEPSVPDHLGVKYFTALPMAPEEITVTTGLGHFAPPGHTLPTPHAYIYWKKIEGKPAPEVFAPASGVVESILDTPEGHKIWVRVSPKFMYILDHVVLLPEFAKERAVLTAGQKIGEVYHRAALDLGAYHSDLQNVFINPSRYSFMTLQARAPWEYFPADLKQTLDQKSMMVGFNKNGSVNFDVAGTLSGNWFLVGVPHSHLAETDPVNWTKQITFGRDEYDPSTSVISVGGVVSNRGEWRTGYFDFRTVKVSSGAVLVPAAVNANSPAYFLVQLLDDMTLKIEHSQSPITGFSANALIYER